MIGKTKKLAEINSAIENLAKRMDEIEHNQREFLRRIDLAEIGIAEVKLDDRDIPQLVAREVAVLTGSAVPRITSLENFIAKMNNKIFKHDEIFRALGADMIARASGGGSVAPPAPKRPKD